MKRPIFATVAFVVCSLCLIPITGWLYVAIDRVERHNLPRPFEVQLTLRPESDSYRMITLAARGQIDAGEPAADTAVVTLMLTHHRGVTSTLVLDVSSNTAAVARITNLPTRPDRRDQFIPVMLRRWLDRQNVDVNSPAGQAELTELAAAIRMAGLGEQPPPWPLEHFEQRMGELTYASYYPHLSWAPPIVGLVMFIALVMTYVRRCDGHKAQHEMLFSERKTGRLAF